MRQSTTLLFILASTVCAADIVSFYFPGGYEGADPVATINTVNPTMTEFRMACPTGVDSSECAVFSNDDVKFLTVDVIAGNSLLRTETSTAPSASVTTTKTSAQSTSVATLTRSASTGQMTVESVSETASASASATISTVSTPSIVPTPTSSQSSASVPESTGAAARFGIEGSALLVLAGAAALNVW
ncbi:hypothetical protein GGP41_008214 [Bipolaris sorokiniana]|uniref:GPI anchored protein n=1 Tax=Cochliobolus sativus TaxID=45130 RepID=A0A8H5ZNP8_COCSA|nr:hypothetical protein GGP41_008214 [Bipolaris sorokiniana]